MEILLFLLVTLPLIAMILLVGGPSAHERFVARVTQTTLLVHLGVTVGAVVTGIVRGWRDQTSEYALLNLGDYHFHLRLGLDWKGALFVALTSLFSCLIIFFSRHYLHREHRFRRFFMLILLMVEGLSLMGLADGIDTFIIGWEMVGLSSILLIGFYTERIQAARNAFSTLRVYRLCDIGLVVGAAIAHGHLLGFQPTDGQAPHLHLLAFLLVLAAIGKSAQFPFINWLPRAMEGPTPSSAVFYGALSVHSGVFLLEKTADIWAIFPSVRILIATIGVLSIVSCTLIGRPVSNIKGQLAYQTSAQIGIIFLELALGFRSLAMIHLAAHATLRCYQILISPSILVDTMHHLNEHLRRPHDVFSRSYERLLPLQWQKRFYVFAVNEGFIGRFPPPIVEGIQRLMARHLGSFPAGFSVILAAFALVCSVVMGHLGFQEKVPLVLSLTGVAILVGTVAEFLRKPPMLDRWRHGGATFVALMMVLYASGHLSLITLSTIVACALPAWFVGLSVLKKYGATGRKCGALEDISPAASKWLLGCFVVLACYPLSPMFWAEDMIMLSQVEGGLFGVILPAVVLSLISIGLGGVYFHAVSGVASIGGEVRFKETMWWTVGASPTAGLGEFDGTNSSRDPNFSPQVSS